MGRLAYGKPGDESALLGDLYLPDPDAFAAFLQWLALHGLIEVLKGIKEKAPPEGTPEYEDWSKFFLEMKGFVTGFGKAVESGEVDFARSTLSLMTMLGMAGRAKEFMFRVLKARPMVEMAEPGLGEAERPPETSTVLREE